MRSVVLIIPTSLKPKADALGEALGHGPNSYSVPLSANGSEPATHYGLHTWAKQSFVDMLAGASQGIMPDGLDYPADDFAAAMAALVASVRDDATGHFADVVSNSMLTLVSERGD